MRDSEGGDDAKHGKGRGEAPAPKRNTVQRNSIRPGRSRSNIRHSIDSMMASRETDAFDNLRGTKALELLKSDNKPRGRCCTMKQWFIIRRRIKWVLETTNFGLSVDVGNVLLSILACGIYVCQVESPNVLQNTLITVDIVLTCWFIFDYILRMVIADNLLEAMFSREYISDFISILPGLVEFIPESMLGSDSSEALQVLRLLRILKVLRLLRIQRLLLYFGDDEVSKQIFFMTLVLVFCVFFFSGLYHFVENLPGALEARYNQQQDAGFIDVDQNWNDLTDAEKLEAELSYLRYGFGTAAYFVVVTMTTVGYGDYSPSTGLAEAVAVMVIIVAVVVVSYETNALMTTISDQSIWKNRKYTVRPRRVHVVVAGAVNSNGIRNFLAEFFNGDQFFSNQEKTVDVVLMAPCAPAQDVLELIEEPEYSMYLHYIAGSVLSKKDLKRAAVGQAQAIWLLSDKFDREAADEADSLMILRCLQVARYVEESPQTPPVHLQLVHLRY